jgi:hypothetical protein
MKNVTALQKLKKSLNFQQQVLLRFSASLMKSATDPAPPDPPVAFKPTPPAIPNHSASFRGLPPSSPTGSNPAASVYSDAEKAVNGSIGGEALRHSLATHVDKKRVALKAKTPDGVYFTPHGEALEALDQSRGLLTQDGTQFEAGMLADHVHDAAKDHLEDKTGALKKLEQGQTPYSPITHELLKLSGHSARTTAQEARKLSENNADLKTKIQEALTGSISDTERNFLTATMERFNNPEIAQTRKSFEDAFVNNNSPEIEKARAQAKKQMQLEDEYKAKANRLLWDQLDKHIKNNGTIENFKGDYSSLGPDPKLKHSEKALEEAAAEQGKAAWIQHRIDSANPEYAESNASSDYWGKRGLSTDIRSMPGRNGEQAKLLGWNYLPIAIARKKAEEEQGRNLSSQARAFRGTASPYGINQYVPQSQLEAEFLEKKGAQWASAAKQKFANNLAKWKKSQAEESDAANKLKMLEDDPSSRSILGTSGIDSRRKQLQDLVSQARAKTMAFKKILDNKTLHNELLSEDDHHDPYFLDAIRRLHNAGGAFFDPRIMRVDQDTRYKISQDNEVEYRGDLAEAAQGGGAQGGGARRRGGGQSRRRGQRDPQATAAQAAATRASILMDRDPNDPDPNDPGPGGSGSDGSRPDNLSPDPNRSLVGYSMLKKLSESDHTALGTGITYDAPTSGNDDDTIITAVKATLAKIFPPNASDTQANIEKLKGLFGEKTIAPWLRGGTNAEQNVKNMLENIEQGIEKIGPGAGLDFLRKLGVQDVPQVQPAAIDHVSHIHSKLDEALEKDTSFLSPPSILRAFVTNRAKHASLGTDPTRIKGIVDGITRDLKSERYLKDQFRPALNNLDRQIAAMQAALARKEEIEPSELQLLVDRRSRLSTLLDASGNDFLKQYMAFRSHKRGGLNHEFLRSLFSDVLGTTLSGHTPRKEFFNGKFWEHLKHDPDSVTAEKFNEELGKLPEAEDPRLQKFLDALNARASQDEQPSE